MHLIDNQIGVINYNDVIILAVAGAIMATNLPRPFGKYLLVRRLAVGGMAEIYLAKSIGAEGFQKDVVIKLILPSFSEDEAFVTMFIDEARIAARLHHPNIVQIYDFDRVDESYYIAMEYVEGADLRKVMDRALKLGRRIPPLLAAQIASEVAAGLRYAHTRKGEDGKPLDIIHRDVSPHNILVSFLGEVKITDFGIAKAAARSTKTRAGTVKGKCAYMSPEQARGKPLDGRSDMFALCAITWEMLTGRRPFDGDSDFEILNNVLNMSLPPPSLFAPTCPRELDAIVLKGLRKEREERYPDMAALEKDLKAFVFKHASQVEELSLAPFMQELFAEDTGAEQSSTVPASPMPSFPSKSEGTLLLSEEENSPPPEPVKPPKTIPVGKLRQELDEILASQPSISTTDFNADSATAGDSSGELPTMALSSADLKEAIATEGIVEEVGGATGRIRVVTGSRSRIRQRSKTPLLVLLAAIILGAVASAVYFIHVISEPAPAIEPPPVVAVVQPEPPVTTQPVELPVLSKPMTVTLDFDVTPASATVFVDGEAIASVGGKRSLANKYKVGDEVTVTARANGYRDYQARVKLQSEKETVIVKMEPLPKRAQITASRAQTTEIGYVNLNAKPWADVFFRGRKLGTTPLRGVEVPVGSQTFVFKKDTVTRSITVVVEKGKTVTPPVVEM